MVLIMLQNDLKEEQCSTLQGVTTQLYGEPCYILLFKQYNNYILYGHESQA